MQWVSRLTRACEENRLELYYQPIVPIGANRDPRGHFELLLRMRDENGELVLPAEFIPAAERYNVMPMIDRWVVRQALGTLAHYRTDGDARHAYTLSINLSGTSLNDDRFLEFLINELQTTSSAPARCASRSPRPPRSPTLPTSCYFMRELRTRGCQLLARRFRQRPVLVHVPEEPAGRLPEDRRPVHPERDHRSRRPQHGRGDQPDRPRHGHQDHRRAGRVRAKCWPSWRGWVSVTPRVSTSPCPNPPRASPLPGARPRRSAASLEEVLELCATGDATRRMRSVQSFPRCMYNFAR